MNHYPKTYLEQAIADGQAEIKGEGKKERIYYLATNHSERWSDPEEKVRVEFWAELIYNPSYFRKDSNCPVEQVTWDNAQEFCGKLSEKTGKSYQLPSEVQWVYSCKAGSTTRRYFGDCAEELGEYAWYGKNSNERTHLVGQKKPNQRGLYYCK